MTLITIAPIGGLCNRMRALESALCLGGQVGARVELLWYRDPSLNCRFQELFSKPDCLSRVIDIDLTSTWGRWCRKALIYIRSHGGRRLYDQKFIATAKQDGMLLEREFRDKSIFIETSSAFTDSLTFEHFSPVQDIERVISSTCARLDNAVGVHIRRSDNDLSIKHSPTEKFEEIMSGMLGSGYCDRFFLATDSADVEQHLIEKFGENVVVHHKYSYDRSVDSSIRDAVVDLYCLASCKKIVGSYWSSFSETAAQIGNKELMVVDNRAETNLHVASEVP